MRWVVVALVLLVGTFATAFVVHSTQSNGTKLVQEPPKEGAHLELRVASMQNAKSALQNMLHSSPRGVACARKAAARHWTLAQLRRCEMSTG